MPRETLTIGGRSFMPAGPDMTFNQHVWMMRHARAAGLLEPCPDTEEYLGKVLDSGRVCELLAGSLVEEGKPWTPESAEENAKFFGNVTGETDIATLRRSLLGVIANFFLSTIASSTLSPSFSTGEARKEQDGAIVESSTPETGLTSSESLPENLVASAR